MHENEKCTSITSLIKYYKLSITIFKNNCNRRSFVTHILKAHDKLSKGKCINKLKQMSRNKNLLIYAICRRNKKINSGQHSRTIISIILITKLWISQKSKCLILSLAGEWGQFYDSVMSMPGSVGWSTNAEAPIL